jgi:hypothetical protein
VHPDGRSRAAADVVDRQRLLRKFLAEYIVHAQGGVCLTLGTVNAPLFNELAFVPDGKADIGSGEGMTPDRIDAVRQLGRIGLEKFTPRWRGKKKLPHLDRGPHRAGRRFEFTGAGIELPAMVGIGGAREQVHLGDRDDGRQGLAPEAHGAHRFEVLQRADLAGSVAPQGQRHFIDVNALAVVFDPDQAHARRR